MTNVMTFAYLLTMAVNDGNAFEMAVKALFGMMDAFVSAQNRADIKLYRNGVFVGAMECKSGCGTLSPLPLAQFKRMSHCNFVCYIPRFCGMSDLRFARVLSYNAFIGLLEKHSLIREVPVGSKRGGGFKTGLKPFLPSNTGSKPWDGLKAGREFLKEFYENGETLEAFKNRLGIDEVK